MSIQLYLQAGDCFMKNAKQAQLTGWGHFNYFESRVLRPELIAKLCSQQLPAGSGISRGMGRSYGDAAIGPDFTVDTRRLNRMISFHNGLLKLEAGVTLGDIIRTWLPRGWFLPVTPGTQWVTVGGAIAADVHGKNHHSAGSFGHYVEEIVLVSADGQLRNCRPDNDTAVFWATVGGMGLTGIIAEATIKLQPVETGYLNVDYYRTENLEQTLTWFTQHDAEAPFSVAWLDGIKKGRTMGRSVIMTGRPTLNDELDPALNRYPMPRSARKIPCNFPKGFLNRQVGQGFNALYYSSHHTCQNRVEPWFKVFYPLDVLDDWHRLYGRSGFGQYQAVFPLDSGKVAIEEVLKKIHYMNHANFLGVLKRMGPGSGGILSFPIEGLTIALDLPIQGEKTMALFQELYSLTEHYNGKIYLAKDSFLNADLFHRMYPRWEEFYQVKAQIDPDSRWASRLAQRIGIVGI